MAESPEDLIRAVYIANAITVSRKSDSALLRAVRPLLGESWWERMAITIGNTVYLPDHVENPWAHVNLLKHEAIHVAQYRRWGWLFWIAYLFLPLPVGLAYFRYRWEREAYVEAEIMAAAPHNRDRLAQWVANILSQSTYAWAWPRPLILRSIRKIIKERGG